MITLSTCTSDEDSLNVKVVAWLRENEPEPYQISCWLASPEDGSWIPIVNSYNIMGNTVTGTRVSTSNRYPGRLFDLTGVIDLRDFIAYDKFPLNPLDHHKTARLDSGETPPEIVPVTWGTWDQAYIARKGTAFSLPDGKLKCSSSPPPIGSIAFMTESLGDDGGALGELAILDSNTNDFDDIEYWINGSTHWWNDTICSHMPTLDTYYRYLYVPEHT